MSLCRNVCLARWRKFSIPRAAHSSFAIFAQTILFTVNLTLQHIPLLWLFLLFVVTGMQAFLGMVKSSQERRRPLGISKLFMCLKYAPAKPPYSLSNMLPIMPRCKCREFLRFLFPVLSRTL